ncbi:MAG: carbohydrate kinase family protein [Candidatus Parcubacteria bacterium]|nr:carbohydrate kinase family protein [Candidatus Parcubacteria bacterium]
MLDIITIGTVTKDIFLSGIDRSKTIVFQKRPYFGLPLGAKLKVENIMANYGGSALNTAISFSKQGLNVGLIGLNCGKDDPRAIPHVLQTNKISNYLLDLKSLKELPLSTILVEDKGERTILNYRDTGYKWPKDIFNKKKLDAKVIVVGSLNSQKEIWQALLKQKKIKQFILAANPGRGDLALFKKNLNWLKDIDILVLNREEGAYLTGKKYGQWLNIFKTLDKLVPDIVVLTDGDKGALASNGKNVWQVEAIKPKTLVEKTGAGDAFLSGFIYGLLKHNFPAPLKWHNKEIEEALRYGTINAYNVVRFVGASTGLFAFKNLPKKLLQSVKIKMVD